jgi:hypothetical protein
MPLIRLEIVTVATLEDGHYICLRRISDGQSRRGMEDTSSLEQHLLMKDIENAATTFDFLCQIRSFLSKPENDALAKTIPLVIKHKGQNEKSRFENLLHYRLDFQTLMYLKMHQDEWLAMPCTFDSKLTSSQRTFLPQGTRAVSEYLDTEQDNI